MSSKLTRIVGTVAADASAASSSTPARILCFGDSLTEGYVAHGTIMHPYARALLASFRALPSPFPCVIEEAGLSGELTHAMLPRLGAILAAAKQAERPYSWVVILGGTNDLCYNIPTEQIIRQIYTMHSMCQSHSPHCRTLGLTVPEIDASDPSSSAVDPKHSVAAARAMGAAMDSINFALQKGFMKDASIGSRYSCWDLRASVPQWEQSSGAAATPAADPSSSAAAASSSIWARDPHKRWDSDFVHYSIRGYDFIGECLAKQIMLVERPKAIAENASAATADGAPASSICAGQGVG